MLKSEVTVLPDSMADVSWARTPVVARRKSGTRNIQAGRLASARAMMLRRLGSVVMQRPLLRFARSTAAGCTGSVGAAAESRAGGASVVHEHTKTLRPPEVGGGVGGGVGTAASGNQFGRGRRSLGRRSAPGGMRGRKTTRRRGTRLSVSRSAGSCTFQQEKVTAKDGN